jgi:DNA-binding SARP family transcriptional activator
LESSDKMLSKFICWNQSHLKLTVESNMADIFLFAQKHSIGIRFQHVNAFWKRLAIVSMKKYFSMIAEIFKIVVFIF